MKARRLLLALALLGAAALALRHRTGGQDAGRGNTGAAGPEGPDHGLFVDNMRKPPDPWLKDRYQEINARHFGGALPGIPVQWEERLAQRGKDLPHGMGLEGLWLMEEGKSLILVNPRLKGDPSALTRTLCHEMVHEFLFTRGDSRSSHGPPFQAVLRRLYSEKAFDGVLATDEERAELRGWLDRKKAELAQAEEAIDLARKALEEAEGDFAALNSRIQDANERGDGWPSPQEMESVKSRRDLRVDQYNALIEARNAGVSEFNDRAATFNLMLAYPDGLDEERVAAIGKPAD